MTQLASTWGTPAPVKAAFFDADGTLLSFATHTVPASARRALEALRDAGVRRFLCTGRSPSLLDDVPLDLFDACLSMSGQFCFEGKEVYHAHPICREDMEAVVRQVRQGLYQCLFMEPYESYLSGSDELVCKAFAEANLHVCTADASQALERDVYQLNVFLPPERDDVVLGATSHLKLTRWSPNFADGMPDDGGKAVGVARTLERFGIAPEEAVAFGDGGNDVEMFGAVGTSVAMGNATASVKAVATYVTDSVDDAGVWNACVRLGLVGQS